MSCRIVFGMRCDVIWAGVDDARCVGVSSV